MFRFVNFKTVTYPLLMLGSLLLIACNMTPSVVTTPKQKSAITDFRGLTLGSPPSQDMFLIPGENKMLERGYERNKSYYRHGDELTIGDIKVDSISYSYFDGKLYSIYIVLGQDSYCQNGETLASALAKKYQTLMKATVLGTGERFWEAGFANLDIAISCTSIFSGGKFFSTTVHINDPRLYQEYEKYLNAVISEIKKSRSEKAASEL